MIEVGFVVCVELVFIAVTHTVISIVRKDKK